MRCVNDNSYDVSSPRRVANRVPQWREVVLSMYIIALERAWGNDPEAYLPTIYLPTVCMCVCYVCVCRYGEDIAMVVGPARGAPV